MVLEAFETAHMLWMVYWALANYRLMVACGKEKLCHFSLEGSVAH